ncbi:TIGR03943 family protein [Viridibacillus sp. YIM B01967]|uniref:TIGR03943 family protein n=1 Tax=Viridibacillus soli TaxID=2798301 RepID=A0ABS1HC05_9BACL|nr:TIGR03943 family protein [Viridibacillus soli]MBK3496851.1 TIGR03943 family protein [Viridibacillus soli]
MIRALILMSFTYFFYYLYTSGDNSKYINMKYEYICIMGIILFAILTIVQIISMSKEEEEHSHDCCDHDHKHEKDSSFVTRMFHYAIFIFPLVTGLFLPIATLDSTVVKSKGFSFKAIDDFEEGDSFVQTQYLRPDTSIYYGKDGYDEIMQKELGVFANMPTVALNDENYLKGMETIYNFPGEFIGKKLSYKGFIYKEQVIDRKQAFVLRFGVIHCVADSGVFGMLVEFPDDMKLQNDDWVNVEGTISTVYYQPFKANIPVLKVDTWEKTIQPEEPYTFRGYENPNL